jgi:2-oxoglutarate dehydrogenase complex dehydrogenase (E1) component-like enzyme
MLSASHCGKQSSHLLHCCCAVQVFYELHAERERQGKQAELAIVRLEQLAPFPFDLVCRELYRYPNAEPIWCQEEPMNMGAYFHVQVRVVVKYCCCFWLEAMELCKLHQFCL